MTRQAQAALPRIGTVDYFESIHEDGRDPFGLTSRPYELRKRAVAVSLLGRERYARGLEAGCSVGALSEALAPRCDELVALDVSHNAVATASARLRNRPGVTVRQGDVRDFVCGTYDLVVLGEIGYYLGRDGLKAVLQRIEQTLRPGGHVLAVHFRPRIKDCDLTGDEVHAVISSPGLLETLASYREALFVAELFGRYGDEMAALPLAEAS